MFKKVVSILVIMFSIISFKMLSVSAESDLINIESVVIDNNTIFIDWTTDNLNYNVYKDNKLVYSGKDSEYSSQDLEPGHIYTYKIEVLDEKLNILDSIKLQTSTDKPDKNVDENLNDLIVTTVVKKTGISIDWDDIEGVNSYEIYKNDNYLTTVNYSEFSDNTVNVDDNHKYTIIGKKILDKEEIDEINKTLKENDIKLNNEEIADLYFDEINIVKEIGSIRSHFEENPFKVLATQSWNLRYQTFLDGKWIENPNPFSKYAWFSGDDRGYSATSSDYRTRADVSICFCSAGRSVGLSRDVGSTSGYDKNKKFLDSATASSSGITLSNVNVSNTSKITFKLNHAVGNPLVASLDVDYVVNGEFYSNGDYKLSGEHDQAPHHEVYLSTSGGSYKDMHKFASRGLEWLAPPMANKSWTKSNF